MADAKQGKTPEDFYNGSSQSRVVLAKPRLGGFGTSSFASSSSKSCNPFGSVLRPPQLKPGSNPFVKVLESGEGSSEKKKDEEKSEDRLKESSETEAPKFVPLGSSGVAPRNTTAPVQPTTSASSAGFVFGQNLSERVVIKEAMNNGEADHSSSNGTSELLFTSAAATVKENNQEESASGEGAEGLAAAAAEYERSHARPPPPAAYCAMTGEEDEINVMQISCRLFAWESGSWRERGRGVLRLNDAAKGAGARLVARVSGSLRVVLNTKLWPGMVVEQPATKSLRITAADAQQQIKLFLIMGAPGDIAQLHGALLSRISKGDNMQRSSERLEIAPDEKGFLEKYASEKYDSNQENDEDDPELEDTGDDRLDSVDNKTDGDKSNVSEDVAEQKDSKALKRKEPVEDETSPKRQCP